MDLRQLRCFVAVARTGTYTAAAEELHVAQPAVWKQVRTLERELGIILFAPSGRRVRLTTAGTQLLARAEQLLAGAERFVELAADLRDGRVGVVTVGCLPAHIVGFLGSVIGEFRRQHPDVRVDLRELLPDQAAQGMREGSLDLILCPPNRDLSHGFHVYDIHVVAAVPPRHPWRSRPSISIAELGDTPLLVTPIGYLSRALLDAAFRAEGIEPTIELENPNPAALVALGQALVGIPVLADDALGPPPTRPWPRVEGISGPLHAQVWCYPSTREPLEPIAEAFVEHVRQRTNALPRKK